MAKKTYERCPKCGKKGLYLSNGWPHWGDGTKRCRYCGLYVYPAGLKQPDLIPNKGGKKS